MISFVEENSAKSKSGANVNKLVQRMLDFLVTQGFQIKVGENFNIGYDGKEKQFSMDFSVCFSNYDDEMWLIEATSSVRVDRLQGHEFSAQHIKEIDKDVKRILVVVPDSISEKEMKNKENYAQRVKDDRYVSFFDDVLTVNELEKQIISKVSESAKQGSKSNILGGFSEKSVMNLLNDENNWKLWNDYAGSKQLVKSATFMYFKEIMTTAGAVEGKDIITKLKAFDDIPRLSNRGLPKTDVFFMAETHFGLSFSGNISIKNTSKNAVSIHEGSVSDIILALELNKNSELSKALRNFEMCGSIGGDKGLATLFPDSVEVLNRELRQYNKQIAEFFIFGVNSPLVSDGKLQIANMILFADPFRVWTRDEYIQYYLSKFEDKGQFGTSFQWTYPSGKRGVKIQIKGFVNKS